MPLDHVPGFSLDRVRPPRLRRLLAITRMQKLNMTRKELAAAVGISQGMLSTEIQFINEFGVEAIQARLDELEAPAHPVTPQKRRCVYMVVRNGTAQRCGKPCKGQLCDEHKGSTAPLAGAGRWPGGSTTAKTGRF